MSRLRTAIFVLIVGFVAYEYFDDADRDESGNIVSSGDLSVGSMRVGDCFNDSPGLAETAETGAITTMTELAALPCSEPHDNEIYAVFDLALEIFPGDEEIIGLAQDECVEHFESFVGISYEESILYVFNLAPVAEGWTQGDREVACALYQPQEKLTSSMRGAGT
jgi:hypothetical protein